MPDGHIVLTLQQQQKLKDLHRNIRGSLLQLEYLLTELDIPHKSLHTAPTSLR